MPRLFASFWPTKRKDKKLSITLKLYLHLVKNSLKREYIFLKTKSMRGASSADWFETKAIRSYPHIHHPNAKGAITRAFTKQSGQPATRIYVLPSYRLIFLKEISNDFSIECSLFISFVRACGKTGR